MMHNLKAIFDPDHAAQNRVMRQIPAAGERSADIGIGPDDLPGDWQVEFEERAAILEFDAGLPRERAEAKALAEIVARIGATQLGGAARD